MDGNTTIISLLGENTDIRLNRPDKEINFDKVDDLKPIDEVARKTPLSEEKVKASRKYVREYVNNPRHVLAKGTQGGGKSKAVIVAIYYLVNHSEFTNFVYSAESYDQKLDEVWEDVDGEGIVYDPFTGKEIEFDSEVDTFFLKGLNRLMDECRREEGLPQHEPLGIFKNEERTKTEFGEYCEKFDSMKDAQKYAEDPPDYYDVFEKWQADKKKVRELARDDTNLIVVTPTAMRSSMSIFNDRQVQWDIYGDEIKFDNRKTHTLTLDQGLVNELKQGSYFRDKTDEELIEKANALGKILEKILDGCEDFSLNNKTHKQVNNIVGPVWRKQINNKLYTSKRVDLFNNTPFESDKGIDRGLMRLKLDSLFYPGKYWKSKWDDTRSVLKLIEDEVEALVDEEEIAVAGRVNKLKGLWNTIRNMERYGVFLNEKHDYGSDEVKPGLTPHKVDGERKDSLLMTVTHDFDELFDQGFKNGNRLRVLSASVPEEWFRRKLDRYEVSNNFNEDLNDYFDYIAPKLEENFQIRIVERYYCGSWAMGKRKDEFKSFSKVFKPYIGDDSANRHMIIPKVMKEKYDWPDDWVNCWNSDVIGSNDAEGKTELFMAFTYIPPEIEMIMTYLDLEGDYPELEYENGSTQIPEEYVETDKSGKQRIGYTDANIDGESSLSVAYRCNIETHIDDGLRRLRSHYDKSNRVNLMTQTTEHIEGLGNDRVEVIKMQELLAEIILDIEDIDDFVGKTKTKLIKWIKSEGYDICDSPADNIATSVGHKLNWKIEDDLIEKEIPEDEKFLNNMPKNKWLNWTELLDCSPFGHEKSKRIVNGLKEEVEIVEEEKLGPVPGKIKRYKFSEVEKEV